MRPSSRRRWLALQRRVERITVQDISEAAGVSQRTFFNHFRSKSATTITYDKEQDR
jgi:AcrR family transcriptional regulator